MAMKRRQPNSKNNAPPAKRLAIAGYVAFSNIRSIPFTLHFIVDKHFTPSHCGSWKYSILLFSIEQNLVSTTERINSWSHLSLSFSLYLSLSLSLSIYLCFSFSTSPLFPSRASVGMVSEDIEAQTMISSVEDTPKAVKEWLAATFTKQIFGRRSAVEPPKFRSIVQAVRASMYVDKITRKPSQVTPVDVSPAQLYLQAELNNWDIDVFKYDSLTSNKPFRQLFPEILNRYGLIKQFKINLCYLENFCALVEQGYNLHGNPYHNAVHGADVLITTHNLISSTGFVSWLSEIEILALLFSAMIHDVEHTGTTNNFHICTSSPLSILYNDRSVLENHHISTAYRYLTEPESNPFEKLSKDDFREMRGIVVEAVLGTDMSAHFTQIKNMQNALFTPSASPSGAAHLPSFCMHGGAIPHLILRWGRGARQQSFKHLPHRSPRECYLMGTCSFSVSVSLCLCLFLSLSLSLTTKDVASFFSVNRNSALTLVLHCADISHPTKGWDLHKKWTDTLMEEFFKQGDTETELGLPNSPLCNRAETLVPESQVGFIDFIIVPSMNLLGDMFDSLLQALHNETNGQKTEFRKTNRPWDDRLAENRRRWKDLVTPKGELTIRDVASFFSVNRNSALTLVLHCADISHPTKGWDLHKKWTDTLMEEFFKQGDTETELGLPNSPLCNRAETLVPESQVGFIDFIIVPSMNLLGDMFDSLLQALHNETNGQKTEFRKTNRPWDDRLAENRRRWKDLVTPKELPTPETTAPETNGVIPETSEEGDKDQPSATVDVEPAGSSENGGP
eukprot:sb/3462236/